MSQTIYIKCVSSTDLQWSENQQSWSQLTSQQSTAPTISATGSSVTFEFLKSAQSTYDILYKDSQGHEQSVGTSDGPTIILTSGNDAYPEFSRDDTTKRWYVGHVIVSPDAR